MARTGTQHPPEKVLLLKGKTTSMSFDISASALN